MSPTAHHRSTLTDVFPQGPLLTLGTSLLILIACLGSTPFGSDSHRGEAFDESALPKLPSAVEAPPANLVRFKKAHPRLPAPTPGDHERLLHENPSFLNLHRTRARGGSGDLGSAIQIARLEPGSVDLDLLRDRLLALTFDGRGMEQTDALALAYDWLYEQWSPADRQALLRKTLDGCDYEIQFIREQRLSPYNVILYNSPLQALVACAIATYQEEDPRSAPVMNFTTDLWMKRVLPVWRQVMGQRGGWHEGGEYVGIGIGQAIYQVPNMWRSATGEDLFATEPGIRGFLDFLVYRTRPDGSSFRWGDGAYFDRDVPDALALALEYHHPQAYSLKTVLPEPRPTSWPWGPMTNPTLYDPRSFAQLPLVRQFDGIGMFVARSSWSADSTYVTFKAGDNFWSHSHLDQGAFTIYKGGPLAIDSGFYGPGYGSDHHMNYSYQSIAHNIVTVTDPEDNAPAPGKKQPRPIANDGGQRRVGSGWGVEAAPLDRTEWEAKREIYHTGTVAKSLIDDGIVVALADLTPAYTNRRSGGGTFSDRMRRVERFWRVFAYDAVDDVVIVFDDIRSTNAVFRKRWLLHMIEQPQIDGTRFSVQSEPQPRPGRSGGRLDAVVLLPKDSILNAIGGRGFEFFVDGKNYGEGGKVLEAARKIVGPQVEPGAWRIEVSPGSDSIDDRFLVVLMPSSASIAPPPKVRLIESGGKKVGCEIVGSKRLTRWWFEPGKAGVEIEIVAEGVGRNYRIDAPELSVAQSTRYDWLDRLRGWFGDYR